MWFLPFENLSVHTFLRREEVFRLLEDSIEPPNEERPLNRDHKPYRGSLAGSSFSIERIIHYRNSFLPQITGTISTVPGMTVIRIQMRMATPVIYFSIIWLGLMGAFSLFLLFSGTNTLQPFAQSMTYPFEGPIGPIIGFSLGAGMIISCLNMNRGNQSRFSKSY